jgi:PAS domain S-box-containing protein
LELVSHAGASEDTLAILKEIIGDGHLPYGCLFTAQTLQTGRRSVCNDIAHDPQAESWREAALQREYHSMVTLPIKSGKKVIGVFNLYAREQNFFDDQELDLLDESAMDISFALEVSRHEEERRRVEEANTLLATAVEQSLEMTMITDVRANIVYVNSSFERITGYTKQEVLGQNPRFLKSGKHDAAFYRQMWDTLLTGNVWAGRVINKKKNGTLYEEDLTISPVRDGGGKIFNYVSVKRDITQQVALENQLRQSQKMDAIGHLAGGIAHDFNNLLTAIHGNASLMLGDDLHSVEIADCSQQIMEAVDRAAGLTRQLLMFSRKQVMQSITLDLNDVVVQITKMLKRILGEDICLTSTYGVDLPTVRADKGMMEQVILNLAINARDAMPEGGKLNISTAIVTMTPKKMAQPYDPEPRQYVRLEVADTGCGITPDHLSLIFEPFFTTKPVGKGTGLGLATVYGIVEQHQGWIDVASEVGKGTTFRVYLPAVDESVVQPKAASGLSSLPTGTETILMVEDDPSLRPLVSRILERCGYTVLCAASGPDALQVWQEHRDAISLLLTDLVMPEGMTGLELAQRLLKERPRLKVVYTSGYPARAGDGPPLMEGVNFLQKPYSTPNLAQTVRNRLDQF